MPNTPDQKIEQQPWTRTWWGMSILVAFILLLLLIGFFAKRTLNYYQQIQTGTVDLSAFSSEAVSKVDASQTVQTINNSYINNFQSDPTLGPSDAVLTVVMFEDFECPFCGELFPDLRATMNTYGDRVRFVYRDFPVASLHPDAEQAAQAGQCANEQGKFWEYHDLLFKNQDRLAIENLHGYATQVNLNMQQFDECLSSGKYAAEIQEDLNDGLQAGVVGTPTIFFNGNKVQGVLTLEGLNAIIEQFLNQK